MLVLTRKHQEKIRIGDNITITVIRTKGKSVRLGIEAPPEVPVIRGELVFQGQSPELDIELSGLREIRQDEAAEAIGGKQACPRRTQSAWPATAMHATPTDNPGQPGPRVSHHRIPRAQVIVEMPGITGKAGPLREMLDRRALTA
jgi:carbon storage regulator